MTMSKKFLSTCLMVFATIGTHGAMADQCTDSRGPLRAEIASAYDGKIAHYKALESAGAAVVKVDLDGDGPEAPQEIRIRAVIKAYEEAKAEAVAQVDASTAECQAAVKKAERLAKTSLALDPGGIMTAPTIDQALADAGLGPNSDLRGALTMATNPAGPMAKVITEPKKVIRSIADKPLQVFTPWKW